MAQDITVVADRIQKLVSERREHSEAIARIDQVLRQIGDVLGGTSRGPGRPPTSTFSWAPHMSSSAPKRRGRRGRRSYSLTATDLITNFVRDRGSPTTQDIKQLWNSEGRKGTADNVLSLLVRTGKLRRKPVEEGRGSRYVLA